MLGARTLLPIALLSSRSLSSSVSQSTCPAIINRLVIRSMSSTSPAASKHTSITHECLSDLYKYWFEHAPADRDGAEDGKGSLKMPTESLKLWFQGGESVDKYCKDNFKGAVEQAIQTPVEDLISLGAKDSQGKDALALILLLDQMPRNIYRGKEAKIAYEKCDPKAQQLAKAFTSDPYNFDSKEKCPTWWHQSFIYMPLLHSESPEMHEYMQTKLQEAISKCSSEGEKKAISQTADFEDKHYNVIKRFGRYPSRNEAMGRKSTPEEVEFLKNGAGW